MDRARETKKDRDCDEDMKKEGNKDKDEQRLEKRRTAWRSLKSRVLDI